jgi:sterol desaturase/sphingolipid hydroxylase (fatty acid hydroxylase superfamily)
MLHQGEDVLNHFAAAGMAGLFAVFGIAMAGFLVLYFSFAIGAWVLVHRVLIPLRIGHIVERNALGKGQIAREIRNSLLSIAIFGAYGALTFAAWRAGIVTIAFEPSWRKLGVDVTILVLWNEIHFYAMHRLLHTRWLFRNVHRIHHQSAVPTPFSTYSFHWIESILLGSVMILAMLVHPFSAAALLALPIVSILLNTIGHWNYNLFANHAALRSASAEHTAHHLRVNGNFGFYLPFFDRWAGTALPSKAAGRSAK